jgi:hypothetical protein
MADNSLARARDFGLLSGKNRVRQIVSRKDKLDFYKFTISGQQSLSLNLKSPRFSDINFSLLNSSGATIRNASRANGRIRPINVTLQTGTFFIRVRSVSRNPVRYSLVSDASVPTTVPGTPGTGTPNPGTSPGTGTPPAPVSTIVDVGSLTGTQSFPKQVVGSPDNPSDFYRFSLPQIGSFNATVSNVTGSAAMKLYFDSNGNGVADSSESFLTGSGSNGGSDPVSATALPVGNYFLEVESRGFSNSTAGYDLTLSTTPNPGTVPTDPGSEAPTAFFLGNLPSTLVAKDYVGRLDGTDVYKFVVNSNVTVNINVGSLSENSVTTDLYKDVNGNNLLDNGERLTGRNFSSSGGASQTISRSLDTGTYFFTIARSLSTYNIAYTLTIQGS